jgi:hypothetical protein
VCQRQIAGCGRLRCRPAPLLCAAALVAVRATTGHYELGEWELMRVDEDVGLQVIADRLVDAYHSAKLIEPMSATTPDFDSVASDRVQLSRIRCLTVLSTGLTTCGCPAQDAEQVHRGLPNSSLSGGTGGGRSRTRPGSRLPSLERGSFP